MENGNFLKAYLYISVSCQKNHGSKTSTILYL